MATISRLQWATRIQNTAANLETAEANWATLTAAQKDQAMLLAVRVALAIAYQFAGQVTP